MRRALILVVLLFASSSFLILQFISMRGLDDQNSWTSRIGKAVGFGHFGAKKDSPAWRNLKSISDISKGFNIELFIVDPEILQDIVIDQLSGNSSSKYIWNFGPQLLSGCRHVCGKKRIVLGVFGDRWSEIRSSSAACWVYCDFHDYVDGEVQIPTCKTAFSLSSINDNQSVPFYKFLTGNEKANSNGQLDNFLVTLIRQGFQNNCCKDQDPRLITVDKTLHSTIDFHCSFTAKGNVIDIVIFYQWQGFLWHGSASEAAEKMAHAFGKSPGAYDQFALTKTSVDDIAIFIPKRPSNFVSEMKSSKFIECDVKQARAFYSEYGEGQDTEAELFLRQATEVLRSAKRALDGLGVRFWLSSGTCLGWYRQCGIIPHSKDVDIGIWIKDYDRRLIDRFNRYGLILSHKFGKVEDSFELSFRTHEENIKLDVFFFYEERGYMWNGGTQARTGKKFKYIFPKFTLCWTEFLSMKVRVPCETRSYIEANYGESWNVPVKTWDWKASPPNVRPNGEWDKKDWSEVIQMM